MASISTPQTLFLTFQHLINDSKHTEASDFLPSCYHELTYVQNLKFFAKCADYTIQQAQEVLAEGCAKPCSKQPWIFEATRCAIVAETVFAKIDEALTGQVFMHDGFEFWEVEGGHSALKERYRKLLNELMGLWESVGSPKEKLRHPELEHELCQIHSRRNVLEIPRKFTGDSMHVEFIPRGSDWIELRVEDHDDAPTARQVGNLSGVTTDGRDGSRNVFFSRIFGFNGNLNDVSLDERERIVKLFDLLRATGKIYALAGYKSPGDYNNKYEGVYLYKNLNPNAVGIKNADNFCSMLHWFLSL